MKELIIHYDLVDKINTANGNVNYKTILLKKLKKHIMALGVAGASFPFFIDIDNKEFWKYLLPVGIGSFCIHSVADIISDYVSREKNADNAYSDLAELASKLSKRDFNTTPDLIKESVLTDTEYEPLFMLKKYILVPNLIGIGKDIKETSILQEHLIGSKDYILSIGSPVKSYKKVPIYR